MAIPLSIQNLSMGHKKPLASGICLDVGENEFVTVMGENGCGKTTLIDCLMGYKQPLSGKISFWGKSNALEYRNLVNSQVGWVVSQREDYPLFQTIGSFLRSISKCYSTWDPDLCEKLCNEFWLDTNKQLRSLSLGELSKVRLIKALSFHPKLVVLDELTANLSPTAKDALLTFLIDEFSTRRLSVLYICHSREEASRLSDRVYMMTSKGLRKVRGSK